MSNQEYLGKKYAFFQNRECEFFPCHKNIESDKLNCLFCYCPLYVLGEECGGNPKYTKQGIKDCSDCTFPHNPEHYGDVTDSLSKIVNICKKKL